ncbi:MAG TPA: alpha-amylase family glycosyl hydrolase, partial [bacterium]|nr:alpha-amylase family glycosyl hydrolase [bacterium]
FIVVSGWNIPEQRFLLAASDLQVNDSDRDPKRGTEAAGLTETNVLNAGGLEMSSPFLEAIFHQQGEVLSWEDPFSGNTIIPESEKPEDYRKAMLRALEEYQKDRLRFARFQVTSLQFSKNLAAVPTAMSYLRQAHEIRTRKKDPDAMWGRFFEGLRNPRLQFAGWFQDSQARLFSHLWENLPRNRLRDKIFFSGNFFSREDAEKIFDPEANRFGWWKDERQSLVNSDSGPAGMLETFRRLAQNQPRDLWISLEYHAGRNDLFNYLNHALEGYSSRIEPLRKKIRALESQAVKANNPDEKIMKNIEAMDLVDRYLQGLAAHLLNQYLMIPGKFLYPKNSSAPLGAGFEKLFSNTLLSKIAARYLDTRPREARRLYTTEKGFRAYWISNGGEAVPAGGGDQPHILLFNVGAIAYPDKKDSGVKKAWGKIVLKDHFRDWVENHLTASGNALQVYDSKKRVDYGLYNAGELGEGLKAGVPGIQLLGLRVKKSKALEIETPQTPFKNAMELFNALREPALLEGDKLGEFLPRDRAIAEKKYSPERLPALMALVAGLAPQHLARIANWNPEVHGRLRQLSVKNALLFKKGTITFHTGREGSVVFSRSLEDQNRIFVEELDRSFFDSENKKTWFPIRDLGSTDRTKPLFLDPSAIYQIHDRIRGGTNNPRAGINLLRHWDVGILLEDITVGDKVIQSGWGFDVYELERMQNLEPARVPPAAEKKQEPQDMQILEINTRGYLEERGLKNFKDLTLRQLRKIRAAGYNTLWMMGVYEESLFSKEFNRYWGEKKKVDGGQHSSAFAIPGYTINPDFGGQSAFEAFAGRAQKAGLRLMLDYIPNHFALDSPLIQEHPDWFVHRTTPSPDAGLENRFENPTGYFPVELKDGRT